MRQHAQPPLSSARSAGSFLFADPVAADEWYGLASDWLIAKTRDGRKHALLLRENTSYGFRRNLYGLKPIALSLSGFALAASAGYAAYNYGNTGALPGAEAIGATAFLLTYIVIFALIVTAPWVKVPAEAYARRLLEACETVAPAAAPKAASTGGRAKSSRTI